jgi:hypothetical protein
MGLIRVANSDTGIFDYVSSNTLDKLIESNAISHFYRPSEERWVNVKLCPIRGKGWQYRGPERRNRDRREEGKGLEGNWVNDLCREIEKGD